MKIQLALALAIALVVLGSRSALAQEDPKEGVFGLNVESADGSSLHFSWNDVEGASTYHVQGSVDYWPLPLCPRVGGFDNELVTFDEELPAGLTSFDTPGSSRQDMAFKSYMFTIEALDADGEVIEQDGTTSQSDPFCSLPEVADAGMGATPEDSPLLLAALALAALGAMAIAGGAALRTRRAR
ncbi:MAG: hypothetical protein WEB04_07340 [Dehalococcoidia bacterium]